MPMAYLGGFSGLWRQTGGIDLSRSLPIFLIVAGLLIAERAVAQQPEEPIRQIRVGGQTRFYKLERHHIEYAHGPLPIIIYLHGTGTRIADPILTRYNIPFARLPDLEPALIEAGTPSRVNSIPGVDYRVSTASRSMTLVFYER
jgi:hypothetical protein